MPLDFHVRNVDKAISLNRVLDVFAGQLTLEVIHDRRVGIEEEHGDLVFVTALDVVIDAVTDGVLDTAGFDLDEGTKEQIHSPGRLALLEPLNSEELNGIAVEREIASGHLTGCHLNILFSHTACSGTTEGYRQNRAIL